MKQAVVSAWRWVRRQKWWVQALIVVGVYIVIAGIFAPDPKKKATKEAAAATVATAPATTRATTTGPASTAAATSTAAPSTTEAPVETSCPFMATDGTCTTEPPSAVETVPATEPDPLAATEAAVRDALRGNTGVQFLSGGSTENCAVRFTAGDNLTAGLIKKGIKLDVTAVLRAFQSAGNLCDTVRVVVDTSLTTKLGNVVDGVKIVTADYAQDTIGRINFENFDVDDVFDRAVVESVILHSAVWA